MVCRLAWRSIWRNRRRTLITVVSIGFGLGLALFFISWGEGIYSQMIDQVCRMQAGHITLENPEYREAPAVDLIIDDLAGLRSEIEGWPEVDSTKLLVLGQGIAKSAAGNVAAAITGVEPSVESRTSPLARNIVEGTYLDERDRNLVVVGSELARRLNLKVGKKLVITTNDVSGMLVDELCRVKGIFKTGSDELDAYVIQATIGFARRVFRMPKSAATQMAVILKNADEQEEILARIGGILPGSPIVALPWQKVLPEVASYIKVDKGSNWVFQGILIFLILFTIFNTLLMSVLERQREFAVLLAIGTNPATLRFQIFMESVYLGLIGVFLGVALGAAASYTVNIWGIDLSTFLKEGVTVSGFALSTRIYTKLTPKILVALSAIVFGATLILSLIPMRRVSRVSIVDELR